MVHKHRRPPPRRVRGKTQADVDGELVEVWRRIRECQQQIDAIGRRGKRRMRAPEDSANMEIFQVHLQNLLAERGRLTSHRQEFGSN